MSKDCSLGKPQLGNVRENRKRISMIQPWKSREENTLEGERCVTHRKVSRRMQSRERRSLYNNKRTNSTARYNDHNYMCTQHQTCKYVKQTFTNMKGEIDNNSSRLL